MVTITHSTVATLPDQVGVEINKAEWNAGHVLTATANKLLGRSNTGDGAVEEITLGTGLSFTGTTLNVSESGLGTVTSVSVTTTNGVSGTVANPTTTPAISLTLGNITPNELIVGDAGTEGDHIKVNGINYTGRFKVSDLDGTNVTQTILHKHSTTVEPVVVAARSNSDDATHGDVTAGQNLVSFYGTGWAGASYHIAGAWLFSVDTTGVVSGISMPGRWTLQITPTGSVWPEDALIVTQDKKLTTKGELTVEGATTLSTSLSGILKATTGVVSAATPNTDYIPAVMSTQGDLIYGGASGVATRLGIGSANTVLHGGASSPTYSAVTEADISLSANATNDVTTARHGFCPVLPNNAAQFLNGQGNYTTPSGLTIAASYSLTSFSGQTSVTVIHNFGTYPIVQVIDNTGAVLVPLTTINNSLNDFTVTFNASTTGTIIASVGSPQPQAVTVVNAATYTVLQNDRIITVTAAGATITLLTAVGNTGREFNIDNASAGAVIVKTTSSQTIEGQLTQTLPPDSAMSVYSTGAVWRII